MLFVVRHADFADVDLEIVQSRLRGNESTSLPLGQHRRLIEQRQRDDGRRQLARLTVHLHGYRLRRDYTSAPALGYAGAVTSSLEQRLEERSERSVRERETEC